jgi:HK97 family phage major capsid protein
MTATRKELLEQEIRAIGNTARKLTPAEERRLSELTRDLSRTIGHPVSVTRGDGTTCISVDATPRSKAPASAPRRRSAADAGIPYYELVAAGQATRSKSTPARHVHSKPFNVSEMRLRAIKSGAVDGEAIMRMSYGIVRDAALYTIETKGKHLTTTAQDRLDDLLRTRNADVDGKVLAQHVVITSSEAYESAFAKSIAEAKPAWSPEERGAIEAWREYATDRARKEQRAASEGGSFGLAIPILIDPSVIIQSQDQAEILAPWGAKQVLITTSAWHGVSSAGATIAFEAEAATAPDAAVTLAQPTVPVYKVDGVIVASYELYMDYPSFSSEALRMFGAALNDNVSNYTATGSGSSVPTGIITAMAAASSPSHVKVTTAGTVVANDVRAVFAALPERYQANASWMLSPSMVQAVSALAAPSVTNGLAPGDWVPPAQGQPARLLGRPVIVSSYSTSFSSSTGSLTWAVVGDFSRFLIATRLGSTLELVPQIFDMAGTGRPTGQRGLYYLARWGSAPVDLQAFRALTNS